MIFSRINLPLELIKEQRKQKLLLDQVYEFLNIEAFKDKEVIIRLKEKKESELSFVQLNESDQKRVFSIETIKKTSIKYRLRFLDSSLFRSEFPYEAISEISAFEKKYGMKINSFRIMAPEKAFDLENINKDPILFAQLSKNNFYLLHQWGHDLAWHRKLIYWPIQNFKTLILTLATICFLFSFSLPSSVMNIFNFQSEIYLRIWLTIHTFIVFLGISLWIGISFDKSFSQHNWDSKYYNY